MSEPTKTKEDSFVVSKMEADRSKHSFIHTVGEHIVETLQVIPVPLQKAALGELIEQLQHLHDRLDKMIEDSKNVADSADPIRELAKMLIKRSANGL